MIRKFRIRSLKAQIEQCQFICATIAAQFENANLKTKQKAELAHRWDETLKKSHALQLTLDALEKQEKQASADPGSQVRKEGEQGAESPREEQPPMDLKREKTGP